MDGDNKQKNENKESNNDYGGAAENGGDECGLTREYLVNLYHKIVAAAVQEPLLCEDYQPQVAVLRAKRWTEWWQHYFQKQDVRALGNATAVCRVTSTDVEPASNGKRGAEENKDEIESKYWKRRYNFFSRFDDGISMDTKSWFEVTPEKIARHIADRMSECRTICDATAGVGGNAIQFALTPKTRVICVDVDAERLDKCKHNAKVYGVNQVMKFQVGDFTEIPSTPVDAVFISPPWGGPSHLDNSYFSLKDVSCCDIVKMFGRATQWSKNVVIYLPRHTDLHELAVLAAHYGYYSFEVEKIYFPYPVRHLKLIVVYFGPIFANGSPFPTRRKLQCKPSPICSLLNALPYAGPLHRSIYARGIIGRYLLGAPILDTAKNADEGALAAFLKVPRDDIRARGLKQVVELLNRLDSTKVVRSQLRRIGEPTRSRARVLGDVGRVTSPARRALSPARAPTPRGSRRVSSPKQRSSSPKGRRSASPPRATSPKGVRKPPPVRGGGKLHHNQDGRQVLMAKSSLKNAMVSHISTGISTSFPQPIVAGP